MAAKAAAGTANAGSYNINRKGHLKGCPFLAEFSETLRGNPDAEIS
jgi:hypothetical protein